MFFECDMQRQNRAFIFRLRHHSRMGKTTQMTDQPASRPAGEIGLLAEEGVGNISDFGGVAAADSETTSFGDDDQAIRNVISKLSKSHSGSAMSEERLQDTAIDLYNSVCRKIRAGKLPWEQIQHAGELFGEEPQALADRLIETGDRSASI